MSGGIRGECAWEVEKVSALLLLSWFVVVGACWLDLGGEATEG